MYPTPSPNANRGFSTTGNPRFGTALADISLDDPKVGCDDGVRDRDLGAVWHGRRVGRQSIHARPAPEYRDRPHIVAAIAPKDKVQGLYPTVRAVQERNRGRVFICLAEDVLPPVVPATLNCH